MQEPSATAGCHGSMELILLLCSQGPGQSQYEYVVVSITSTVGGALFS